MRCLLYGHKRNKFVRCFEAHASKYQEVWKKAIELKSPTTQYNILLYIMHDSMNECFPKVKYEEGGPLAKLSKQRTEIIMQRKNAMEHTWVRSVSATHIGTILQAWRCVAKLDRINHRLKAANKKHKQTKMNMQCEEIQTALQHYDSATAWRVARNIASAVKGSGRRFAHVSRAQPTVAEVEQQYKQPATEGGWAAIVVDEQFVNTMLEPSFEHVQVFVDANTELDYKGFVRAVHYSKC